MAPLQTADCRRTLAQILLVVIAGLIGVAAQPPKEKEQEDPKGPVKKRPIEEEDPKGKVKKRINVDDEPSAGKKGHEAPGATPPDVQLDELVRAAAGTKHPELKRLFAKFSFPFDRIVEIGGGLSVRPIPFRRSEWPSGLEAVTVYPLEGNGKTHEPRAAMVKAIRSVEHFEQLIHADVEELLKQRTDGSSALVENLAAAELLLAAGIRFHEYARENSYPDRKGAIRSGKGWDELRTSLVAKLREVRLDLLRAVMAAKDTARVREISTRLMSAYPKDLAVAQTVAVARVADAEQLLQSNSHADHVRAKELLDEFEARFPGSGGDAARKLHMRLSEIAQKAFTRAKEKKAVGDLTTARDELARAAALDSTIDGVREMQRELRTGYPILFVGVRQFPVNMSPATARVDSEKQAVELVFEGLLEEVPDDNGAVRYQVGAAVTMPVPAPGGRDLAIRTYERDATGRPGFDSHDCVGTVKLLRMRPDTWVSYPTIWLSQEPPSPRDAGNLRLKFDVGHPDPRATLTFKLLPTRWLEENGKGMEDAAFAERPFGTGPFKLQGKTNPEPGAPREMIFIDNPAYGRWRDRTGLPHLREIRMIEVAKMDTVAAFREDRLHILTDVPTTDLDKYTAAGSGLVGKVQVVNPAANRRVHVLAVNLNRPYLQSKVVRQGISKAIDRDEILREVFRANKPDFHKPMVGPFPPNSWPGPKPTDALPLVNRDSAENNLKTYLTDPGAKTDFSLAYPDDDPRAAAACAKIKSQIEGLLKNSPRKLVINLEGVPLRELMVRVQDEHRYDLAYVPFDYPDDWYPFGLAAALDPSAAGRGGRNWFSFRAAGTNPDADDQDLGRRLENVLRHRDPAQIMKEMAEASKRFNDSLPFIPLWQLDRHMIIHNNLKVFVGDSSEPANPRLLNPTLLFQGVTRWRLD